MQKFKVKVNGKATELAAGRLLPALRAAGSKIPSVCFHPDIDFSGGRCRVCVCKVNGKIMTPCNTAVEEGMNIETDTEELVNLRAASLALSDHTTQDAFFPEATEAIAKRFGKDRKKNVINPEKELPLAGKHESYVVRHPDLCTHCGLCVQMCQSVQGVGAISDFRKEGQDSVSTDDEVRTFDHIPLPQTECINCGQCINVCPYGALEEVQELGDVEKVLTDKSKVKVFQFAPAVRIALAEEFGCKPGERSLTHEMVTAARRLGDNIYVFDTNFTADLTIMEEGYELLERLRRALTGTKKFGGDHVNPNIPMITSCSPGWIVFAEKNYHDLIPHLSSCKSPQQMHGALTKHYWSKVKGIKPEDISTISVMPCVAKKYEKDRDEFAHDGIKDVDHVLTTREFAKLLRNHKLDPTTLPPDEFDDALGASTGAGLIFGATGGVMEAALRTAYEVVTGREVPFHHLNITPVRGMETVRQATIKLEHVLPEWDFLEGVELKIAIAHGVANARKLMDRIRDRIEQGLPPEYHFVEVMGCPGGCLGGGGQPKPTSMAIKMERSKLIYQGDEDQPLRKSHENPKVQQLYRDFLKEPLGHESHHLLHTTYVPRASQTVSLIGSEEAKQIRQDVLFANNVPRTRSRITNVLSDVVDKIGYVSDAAVAAIASHVGATPVDMDSVISHYHYFPRHKTAQSTVYLCECIACRSRGSGLVKKFLKSKGIPYHMTSWLGWCTNGAPAALVKHVGDPQIHGMFNLTPEDPRLLSLADYKNPVTSCTVKTLAAPRLFNNSPKTPSLLQNLPLTKEDMDFLAQKKQCPVSAKAWAMEPEAIIEELKIANLRGCGGAGFPAYFKWQAVRQQSQSRDHKYIVINADEGLPSVFKDFYLMQDPACRMRMIVGACIAARVVNAANIMMYLRYEYKNLKPILEASFQAYRALNPKMDQDVKFEIVLGGGPYVCGEETALFESVEGHVPQARSTRTVFPTHHGVFGQPTLVTNVETISWIPQIVYRGAESFRGCGVNQQQGMKLLSIAGDLQEPILAEYPLGTPLVDVLKECSSIPLDEIAAAEVGGIIEPLTYPKNFDRILSLENAPHHLYLAAGGSILIFSKKNFNERAIYTAKAKFSAIESCQLCTPCREGTKVMRHALPALFDGTLLADQVAKVRTKELIHAMEMSSNCGHGKGCGKMYRSLFEKMAGIE